MQLLNKSLEQSLTHRGRVTRICVGNLNIIGSDNGLLPGWRQAIIWSNAGILLIGPLGKNFSEIFIEILTFSFKKMRLNVSSANWRPFCLGLNVLTCQGSYIGLELLSSLWLQMSKHLRWAISSDNDDQKSYMFSLKFPWLYQWFLINLNLYMLNFSEGTKTYIHILCHPYKLTLQR